MENSGNRALSQIKLRKINSGLEMTARMILGKPIADGIKASLSQDVELLSTKLRVLAINNRENAEAGVYMKMQRSLCKNFGIKYEVHEIDAKTSQEELLGSIDIFNKDRTITGITVHLPLLSHIDQAAILNSVKPEKDIEGTTDYNIGMLALYDHQPVPCAAAAAVECLRSVAKSLKGMDITVIGRSRLVGKPIFFLLMQKQGDSPTVTVCHSGTRDLSSHTLRSDAVILATGRARMLKKEMVKEGSIIIDVGISQLEDGSIVGDADTDNLLDKAVYITPVPSGVGPVTLAILLRNILHCGKKILNQK